jgi:hypothetical protein
LVIAVCRHTVARVLRTMILLVRSLLSDHKNPVQTIPLNFLFLFDVLNIPLYESYVFSVHDVSGDVYTCIHVLRQLCDVLRGCNSCDNLTIHQMWSYSVS